MKLSKPMTITAIAAASAIGLATLIPAFASGDGHGPMGGHGPAAFFEKMDANGDGKVTAEEMTAARAAEFASADADGDGFLSKAEILAKAQEHAQARMEQRAAKMIERGDTDVDMDVKDQVNSLDVGLVIGGGLDFLLGDRNYGVDLRYSKGLSNAAGDAANGNAYNNVIAVMGSIGL